MPQIVPELKHAQVFRQVLAGNVNMGATNGPLQLRPEPLGTVDVGFAALPFIGAVVNRAVPVAVSGQGAVGTKLIGADRAAGFDLFKDMGFQGPAPDVLHAACWRC